MSLTPVEDGEGGRKTPLQVFFLQLLQTLELAPKTFWVLVLTLLQTSVKFQGHTYCQSQIIEL